MNVGRKLMLIVVASVTLVTLPSAGMIYHLAKRSVLITEERILEGETQSLTALHTQNLNEAGSSLAALSRILGKSLAPPPSSAESSAFDKLVKRDPDKAWRSQRENFNGKIEAGIFLPPDAKLDIEQKSLHLRSKRIIDVFGGSVNTPFSNVWLLTHDKTEIIYDHGVPDFVLIMAADTDYTKTEWVTLGDPKINPERSLRWTPPLFDPVPKSWMVSAVMPVDVNGHWIGTIGHDIYLNNVFPTLFKPSQRYLDELHFLLDSHRNFIQAGPWQAELEAKPENFKPDLRNEPYLAELLSSELDAHPHAFEHQVTVHGRQYLAVGMIMQPVGWHYFRLVAVDEIVARMQQLFLSLVAVVLTIGLLIGFLIRYAVKRNIITRLQVLADTVHKYGQGDWNARVGQSGDDEIANTSLEFDAMAEHLKATLDAVPDLMFDVGLDGRYYAAHSPEENLLSAPREQLIGKTIKETLPAEAAEIVMSALIEANQTGMSRGKQFELSLPHGKLWFELSVAKKSSTDNQNPRFIVLSRDITERKQAEISLQDSEFRWKYAIEGSGDGLWDWNLADNSLLLTHRWKEMLGFTDDEIGTGIDEWEKRIHPEDKADTLATLQAYFDGKIPSYLTEHRVLCRDGSYKWILDRGMVVSRSEDGKPSRMIGTYTDITDRKRTENIVEQYRAVIHASLDGFWITDTTGQIIEVNDSICQMLGYSHDELLNMSISDIEADESPEDTAAHIREMLETGHVQFEARHKRKNGTISNVEVSIMYLASLGNRIFAFIRDISHIKQHQSELRHLANFDILTNIPNRLLLADRMSQAIAQTSRDRNMMAICYLDLDGFKPINDKLGHDLGDEVLVAIAKRIEQTIRGGDTVARLGGDEFAVLLLGLSQGEESVATLERLLAAIAQPIAVKGKHVTVSASIGVSLYPFDDEDPDTLLRHADQAMYVAKQSGKNRFHIYDPAIDRRARDQNEFQKSIRHALEKNQFELFYQPKINLRTKELVGAEALIRWRHPERGILPPAEFLSIIENTELDKKIGEWVIATALAQMKYWRSTGLDIEVSINISGYHMESSGFVEKLAQQLAQYPDITQGKLQIEVLETVALNDIAVVREIIESCRKLGVGFALDDFGTGYSSLLYLSGLPVDALKIDQTFVRDMLEDKGDMAVVQGVIALARAFDLKTVAEGIETDDHLKLLLDLGCEVGQGYGIARPMPAGDLIDWKSN